MQDIIAKLAKDKKRLEILEIQRQLYAHTGVPDRHVKSGDLFISDTEFIHYTEIDVVPRSTDNTLVLVHGYGGSNNIFYRMIRHLSREFHIITIDLPGMALSSRVKAKHHFKDAQTCIQFFVDRLDWFLSRMKLDKIHLVGHSIGSYITTHYFNQHSEKVIKLYMLSPAGFNPADEETIKALEKMVDDMPFFKRKMINHMREKIYKDKKSAFEAFWMPFKSFFVKQYFSHKRFSFSREEIELLTDYHTHIFTLPQSGERCLGYLLEAGIKSKMPLIDILEKNRDRCRDIIILYGEVDWMDKEEAIRNMDARDLWIRVERISRADHQIINQNAEEVADWITNFAKQKPNF